MVAFHAFVGCDQTGRFNNKSKTACWKAFLGSSNIILQAFSRLGEKENLPSLETLEVLETFVCLLCKGNLHEINTLAKLSWFMFSKYQYNSENLPPTFGALKYKIFRSVVLLKCGFTCTDMCKCAQCENNDCWIEYKDSKKNLMTISSYFSMFSMEFCWLFQC